MTVNVKVMAPPDVVDMLVARLGAAFEARRMGTVVADRVPSPRPAEFVTCTEAGGPGIGLDSDAAAIMFEFWAPTQKQARDLAFLTRGIVNTMPFMLAAPDGVVVQNVTEAAAPTSLPDPDTPDQYRFVWTAELWVIPEEI